MDHRQLQASIAATNNGYLFAPTAPELACARLHPELFKINENIISPVGFTVPVYPFPRPVVSHARNYDADFDWEGAILARQEAQGFYD